MARRPNLFLRPWVVQYLEDRRRQRVAANQGGPQVPIAPANLSAGDSGTYIQLAWNDMSSDELGFRVYRKVDGGSYGLWQTLGANVTSVQDSGVIVTHMYSYYVVAYNAVGESAHSNVAVIVFGS